MPGGPIASERLGSLAPLLDRARADHQAWLERIFSDHLPKAPTARRHAIHALHAATDVYTWKLLRRDLRLTRAETERIMLDLVNGILGSAGTGTSRRRTIFQEEPMTPRRYLVALVDGGGNVPPELSAVRRWSSAATR